MKDADESLLNVETVESLLNTQYINNKYVSKLQVVRVK